MTESQIVGLIILIIGGLNVVRPDIFIGWQVWSQRVIMRATYIPSERTHTILRFIGAVLILVGLLAITGIIE